MYETNNKPFPFWGAETTSKFIVSSLTLMSKTNKHATLKCKVRHFQEETGALTLCKAVVG